MQKLQAVEEAKTLLAGAMDWSILRWLAEKKRVRTIADKGTAALDEEERRVKSTWSEELRNAYAELTPPPDDDPYAAAEFEFLRQQAATLSEEIRTIARRVKDADDIATEARLRAERTFDEAERKLSASLARRGAEEAIAAYDVRYKAIEEAEAAQGI
jgi:hypothetical protein